MSLGKAMAGVNGARTKIFVTQRRAELSVARAKRHVARTEGLVMGMRAELSVARAKPNVTRTESLVIKRVARFLLDKSAMITWML